MKVLLTLLLLVFGLGATAQSLTLKDLQRAYNFKDKTHIPVLKKKGFWDNSTVVNITKDSFRFAKSNGESVTTIYGPYFDYDGEIHIEIIYDLISLNAYNQIIASAKAIGFKYSKRNQAYISRDGSYVWQRVAALGKVHQHYRIQYISHVGKEVSNIPALQSEPPPLFSVESIDTIILRKTADEKIFIPPYPARADYNGFKMPLRNGKYYEGLHGETPDAINKVHTEKRLYTGLMKSWRPLVQYNNRFYLYKRCTQSFGNILIGNESFTTFYADGPYVQPLKKTEKLSDRKYIFHFEDERDDAIEMFLFGPQLQTAIIRQLKDSVGVAYSLYTAEERILYYPIIINNCSVTDYDTHQLPGFDFETPDFEKMIAQVQMEILVDSLKYLPALPYIENCNIPILWNVVKQKLAIVPFLIAKLDDSTSTDMFVPNFGGKYTLADVAYVALGEIINGIPTFTLLGKTFDENGCGYCSYWQHLRADKKHRTQFKTAVHNWYNNNKDGLVWINSNRIVSGDCSDPHPNGGHYELKNN